MMDREGANKGAICGPSSLPILLLIKLTVGQLFYVTAVT